ncbi:MAG: porin [Gammaproteobacteria bacterium]|jgi:predicted porin|nr:porin [Gammaproteobacteria bacterium]MBT4862335.1 porin [Gammaproteobacteria bacterium]
MKKSPIIAAAIAATIAGSTFAADTTIYGNIRLEVVNQTDLNMDSSKLVVGFKSSEDMGNGMTGFMHMELEHDDANEEVSGWTNDKSYVGLKGDFGQVTLGRQADAAGFACGGTDIFTKVSGQACGAGAINGGLDNALVYTGGTGNVTFVLGATLDGTQDQAGDNTIIAAKYAADNFSVGFQMTSFDIVRGGESQSVIGGTYTINEMQIGATLANDGNESATAIALKMPLAGGSFRIGMDTGEDAGVADTTHVQFTKSLSKSVYTGVEFASVDGADDDMLAGWIGMKF